MVLNSALIWGCLQNSLKIIPGWVCVLLVAHLCIMLALWECELLCFPRAKDSDINQQTPLVTAKHFFDAKNMKWISKAALGYVLQFEGIVLNTGRESFQVLHMLRRFSTVCHFTVAPSVKHTFHFYFAWAEETLALGQSFSIIEASGAVFMLQKTAWENKEREKQGVSQTVGEDCSNCWNELQSRGLFGVPRPLHEMDNLWQSCSV